MHILKPRLTYFAHLGKALLKTYHNDIFSALSGYIPRDGIVIDIGGHAGQFTKLLSRHVKNGKVYSFEPGRYALSILKYVVKLKFLRNVEIVPKALGAEDGRIIFHTPIKKSGSLGFGLSFAGPNKAQRPCDSYDVELITLDSFVKERGLTQINFIKIDIEGGELNFLKGAKNSLKKFKPAIFMEINQDALSRNNHCPEDIADFMSALSYEPHFFDGARFQIHDGSLVDGDYLFLQRDV